MQHYSSPLIFVRHGVTDWNQQARYQGSTETRLSALGREQALNNARVIENLAETNEIDLQKFKIIASPLKRAQQTTEIISQALELQSSIKTESALRELSMGRWEGLTSQQVKDQFYVERKSRKSDRWGFKPIGGESMAERAPQIDAILKELPAFSIIVTHSVVLRVVCHLLGVKSREECAVMNIPHDEILCWNGAKMHRQSINVRWVLNGSN